MPGGGHWSWIAAARHQPAHDRRSSDGANLSLVLYTAREKLERYNMPDSLKAQHTAHYTRGHVLMSDMGRAMASITADSLGWHDPLGLLLDDRLHGRRNTASTRYQQHRNAMYRSGTRRPADRDRQVRPGQARPDRAGELLQQGERGRGGPLRLRARPRQGRRPRGAALRHGRDRRRLQRAASARPAPDLRAQAGGPAAWRSGPAPADDYCRAFRPENARALHNTDMLYLV